MVALPSKSRLQELNIDTVEKALAFACLSLRAALVGSDNSNTDNQDISIYPDAISAQEATLYLSATLPYDSYKYHTNGGVLITSLTELASISPNIDSDLTFTCEPAPIDSLMPTYDEGTIDTVEEYLLYYSNILWASIEDKSSSVISYQFLENQEEAQILIEIELPLDINSWLLGGNYLNSLLVVTDNYQSPPAAGGESSGQSQIVGYSSYYGNLGNYEPEEFHTVTKAGILESISIEADYDTEDGIVETYFYLNGNSIFDEGISDNLDGTYDIVFDPDNAPIFVTEGDVLSFELYEEPAPTYLNIHVYIAEFSN